MGLFMGSVTDQVISQGESTVLVVKGLSGDRLSSNGGK